MEKERGLVFDTMFLRFLCGTHEENIILLTIVTHSSKSNNPEIIKHIHLINTIIS